MAIIVPQADRALLEGPGYVPVRFWAVRGLSFGVVALLLYGFHTAVAPKLGIYDVRLLVLSVLFATLAVSLNLINGITGQFSIGHAAFYLIGAITAGKLSVTFISAANLRAPVWLFLMVLAGAAAAALAGLVVGLPSLRLRGDYLAVATLGFGEIVNVIVRNQDGGDKSIGGLNLGGPYGLQDIPKITQIFWILLLFVFTLAIARNLLKSAHGVSFLAVREDELAADATGVNPTKVKVTAFVLGAAVAGMTGALFAHYNGSISPDDFKMDTSFLLVAMVVIGGTGSITGAACAGIGLKLLEEGLRAIHQIPAVDLFSLILTAIALFLLYNFLKRREWLQFNGALRIPFGLLGAVACAALLYAAYRLYGSGLSVVLKVAGEAVIAGALLGLLITPTRVSALPRFGMLGLSLVAIVSASPLAAKGMHAIGPLEKLLGSTMYTPSDLRWAVFSLALVLVMLLRPQGLLGHQELSWAFVSSLFRPPKRREVLA